MSDAPSDQRDDAKAAKPDPERENSARFFRRRASLRSPKQALQPEAPPPPPPRSKRREGTLSALSGFLSFLLVLAIAGVFGLIATLHKLREPGPLASEKLIYIAPRSDVPEILSQLEREGVIDNPLLMNLALLVEGGRSKLKPGEYLFKQNASLREVMDDLVNGRQVLHAVTIPEGLTSEQIVLRLRDNGVLAGDVTEPPKEGALLPETYKVARGYPRSKLLAKMQEDQRKLLQQIWARRSHDLPVKTPFELVTLASIIEKETGKADERARVAGVFVNRLRKGMRLQSDPTIVYGIVGGRATLGHSISRSEVERWTAYNTYAIDGLPPGPIANPGKAALEAAANPSRTQEFYFVADGTGGHVFAETLEQHARNVQRWRQLERDAKDKGTNEIDRVGPETLIAPAQPGRGQRGDAGDSAIGRLVAIDENREEYPQGLAISPDSGALKRFGAVLPSAASAYVGENEAAMRLDSAQTSAERRARPVFTRTLAQRGETTFNAALLAAGSGASNSLTRSDDVIEAEGLGERASGTGGRAYGSYPVSAKIRAEQKARATKLGLPPGSDDLPSNIVGARVSASESAGVAASPGPLARAHAFDASEGTALDPLRAKSWDLNSAKSVPNAMSFR